MKINNISKELVLIDHLKRNMLYRVFDNEEKTFILLLLENKDYEGNFEVSLEGFNSKAQILGIIIAGNKQKIKLYTHQNHTNNTSKSNLFIRSILFDKARMYYEGKIVIEKGAAKSDAYQKNQSLLMGRDCRIFTRPSLEIMENDIKCTHGSTVSRIDGNNLYYLNTRGLTYLEAEKLIIEGFVWEVLKKIEDDVYREHLFDRIKINLSKRISVHE